MASKKAVVPDFATVPKFLMSSALVIPMPVSVIDTVLASKSKSMRISSWGVEERNSGF